MNNNVAPKLTAVLRHYLPTAVESFDMLNIAIWIHLRELLDTTTNGTKIVQSLMFGTGPTVKAKVSQLVELGYVRRVNDPKDGRSELLQVTDLGKEWLSDHENRLNKFLKEAGQ